MNDQNRVPTGLEPGHALRWRYPVLIACLTQDRKPVQDEIRILADRLSREIGRSAASPSRPITSLARAALEGSGAGGAGSRTIGASLHGH